jgi:hypothetical protein
LCTCSRTNGEDVDAMLGFTEPVGGHGSDPLANVAAADDFWRLLPRSDPLRAQRLVVEALTDFGMAGNPGAERLRALLAFDRRSRNLFDALLVNYSGPDPRAKALERRYWQSAHALGHAFGDAYARVLRRVERDALARAGRDYAPVFLLRLFQHRQIEMLLLPFEPGNPDPIAWAELHEAYQYAHSQRVLAEPQEVRRNHDTVAAKTTIEREYVHLLLSDRLADGHLAPYDAFWVNRWLARASSALHLRSIQGSGASAAESEHFVVDLDSAQGLVRSPARGAVRCLLLDPAPLLALIDEGIRDLRDGAKPVPRAKGPGGAATLKLLRKLRTLYSPKPPRVARRGERKSVAVIVEAVVGFDDIVRMLHRTRQKAVEADPAEGLEVEEITIAAVDGASVSRVAAAAGSEGVPTVSPAEDTMPRLIWEMNDRSDSGCRLTGKTADMKRALPGTLVSLREHELAPWTLAVVRRREARARDRIEIGVEFVGREPRRVIATTVDPDAKAGDPPSGTARRHAVLYLPESPRQPALPMKTLIVPMAAFDDDARIVLRTALARYTIRLKQPIEEQSDFTWLPFDLVLRQTVEA